MVWSPGIRVFSDENVETVMKKPGSTNLLPRKPFEDRPVNAASPAFSKNLKPDYLEKTASKLATATVPAEAKTEEDLFFYDTCSFKTFEDSQLFPPLDIVKILRSYCQYDEMKTPPPLSPKEEIWNEFEEVPEMDFTFEDDPSEKLVEYSIEDVSLPEIEFD